MKRFRTMMNNWTNASVLPLPTNAPLPLQLVTPQEAPRLRRSSFSSSLFLPLAPHLRQPLATSSGFATSWIWGRKSSQSFWYLNSVLSTSSDLKVWAAALVSLLLFPSSSRSPLSSARSTVICDTFADIGATADMLRWPYKVSECFSLLYF